MKYFRNLLLIAAVLLVSNGFCQECCFEFSGDWLYMLSAIDQPYFAQNKGNLPSINTLYNDDRIANNQEWHSGYRVEAAYAYKCTNKIVARWTQFPSFSDTKADHDALFGVFTLPAAVAADLVSATIRDEFDLYYLDVFYRKSFYCHDSLTLAINFGAQFAHIDLDEEVLYSPSAIANAQLIENQSKLRGVGPELGINFKYTLCSFLLIKGEANAGILISRKQSKNKNINAGTLAAYSENDTYWLGTPSIDFRLGMGFDLPLPGVCFSSRLNFEAGYEIIHFVKGVDRIFFIENVSGGGPGLSFTQQMDFTLQGPYVHLGICF